MSEVYTRAFELPAVAELEYLGNMSARTAKPDVHRNLLYRWHRLWGAGGGGRGSAAAGGPASDRTAAEAQGSPTAAITCLRLADGRADWAPTAFEADRPPIRVSHTKGSLHQRPSEDRFQR